MLKIYPEGQVPPLIVRLKELNYATFNDGNYDLNIVGLRRLKDQTVNQFDDEIVVLYTVDGRWRENRFVATTDPGRFWLVSPTYKPCAVMYHPQQRRGAYKIGLHRGRYEALVQVNKIKFWRDGDKNEMITYDGPVYNDIIGLNIHRSSKNTNGAQRVDRYSAGCQVFKFPQDYDVFMELCKKQVTTLGYSSFSYTLIPME